jgi:phosphoglycerate kinase
MLRSLQDLELKGKKIFLRLDLNVPMDGMVITDTNRIDCALETIRYILQFTNKIAICSHLGRPKGKPDPEYSLEPVGAKLAELLELEVIFSRDYLEESASRILDTLKSNQILLLENLRYHAGEEKNDKEFANKLMTGFDFYVDDAFGAVHRAHASVVACAELMAPEKRAAGLLIHKEVIALNKILKLHLFEI